MTQNRYSVFLSLLLLLLLTGGFVYASRVAYNALHTRIEAALATATVTAIPVIPTHPRPTPTPRGTRHQQAAPTSTPASSSGNVVISTSTDMGNAASTFSSDTQRYWCLANMPNVSSNDQVVWEWQHLLSNTVEGLFTSQPYNYDTAIKEGYIDGPFDAGQYRCQVLVNGRLAGSAVFTVK